MLVENLYPMYQALFISSLKWHAAIQIALLAG
jgi:hypothetical protein